jgi:glyoxylase-like metal-dependent hydrolase (beta-lactamase superfamily II)
MLEIVPLELGELATNTYLISDSDTREAAVIDPAGDGQVILAEAKRHYFRIEQIWCTHAHFDHIGGVGELARVLGTAPVIALHPADLPLWQLQGGASLFGHFLPASPAPTLDLAEGMELRLGNTVFEVLHTPGHTPGHCIYYCASAGVCFCGDLIFQDSVGRTDLPGGNWDTLVTSIRSQVFSLPDETRLLPGHGPETMVGQEKKHNPFVHA